MTRRFFLLISFLVASFALAQTYVRPSKGTAIRAFTDSGPDAGFYPLAPSLGLSFTTGTVYDWTAFQSIHVRIYTDSAGTSDGGVACSAISRSYNIDGVDSYVRFERRKNGTAGTFLNLKDSPFPAGPFNYVTTSNASLSLNDFVGCKTYVMLTPLPFSDSTGTLLADGGFALSVAVTSTASSCAATQSTNTSVGTTPTAVPASPLANRSWARICNKSRNSGTPIVTCTDDLTNPDAGINGKGEDLEVGDCAVYNTNTQVTCISDTASTSVSSEECR